MAREGAGIEVICWGTGIIDSKRCNRGLDPLSEIMEWFVDRAIFKMVDIEDETAAVLHCAGIVYVERLNVGQCGCNPRDYLIFIEPEMLSSHEGGMWRKRAGRDKAELRAQLRGDFSDRAARTCIRYKVYPVSEGIPHFAWLHGWKPWVVNQVARVACRSAGDSLPCFSCHARTP